jgi:3-isopropylmalate/(R)-2-methylmalate dehydratase small subunit
VNASEVIMMEKKIKGKAYVCGRDDVDTDMIIPAKYLNTHDPKELAQHAMEFIDPRFPEKAKKMGIRIVVGGKNFGCGSSREHAVWCLAGNGIRAVIADSFARIFFRNCVNYGLLPVACQGAGRKIRTGDEIEIDASSGKIRNLTRKEEYAARPLPGFAVDILNAGGLLRYVKKTLDAAGAADGRKEARRK